MEIIGLTGGVASGKSTATEMFKGFGIPVIDCDQIVRNVQTTDKALMDSLEKEFPGVVVNASLDRAKLSTAALKNQKSLERVESLTLPFVRREVERQIAEYRSAGTPIVVLDAPTLFEKGWDDLCTTTVCVYADPEVQKKRYLKRPGATIEKFNAIIKRQMPTDEKLKRAKKKFKSHSRDNLYNQIESLVSDLKSRPPERVAFYAGSFDPMTRGHWKIICGAIKDFDRVIVGIGINPNKKDTGLFTPEQRLEAIKKTRDDFLESYRLRAVNGISFTEEEKQAFNKLNENKRVLKIIHYSDMTVDAALREGATHLVRGARSAKDFEEEVKLSEINEALLKTRHRTLSPALLMPQNAKSVSHISSSEVKTLCAAGEYIVAEEYVTPSVHAMMIEKYLFKDFERAAKAFGYDPIKPADQEKIRAEYESLTAAYRENRHYHNMTHIAACLNYLNIYETANGELSPEKHNAIVMAIFYHDVAQGKNAEDLSKARAQKFLGDQPLVTECIEATKHFSADKKTFTPLQKIMSDIDLTVLGGTHYYSLYTYIQKVRQEYPQFDDAAFAKGRSQVLRDLMALKPLYQTAFFKERFEEPARENMEKELRLWHGMSAAQTAKQRKDNTGRG